MAAAPGTDFSRYQSWEHLTAPNGAEYYVVPGTGLLYSPSISQLKGRPVLFQDPRPDAEKQAAAQKAQQDQVDAQKKALSPVNQLIPIAGGVAGLVGGKYLVDSLAKPTVAGVLKNGSVIMSDGSTAAAGAGSAATAGSGVVDNGVALTGTSIDGGADTAAGAFANGVGAAPASGFSLSGIGAAGNYFLPAAGALGAFDLLTHDRGPLGGALEGAASGAAIGSFFPGPGTLIGAGVGGLVGLAKGLFGDHETTAQHQAKNWAGLADSAADPTTKAYAQQYQQYLQSDQAKQDAQNKPRFGDLKAQGKLTPEDVWGGIGLFKTFGGDWLNKYSEDDRRKISQGLIDHGLLTSEKGDIQVTNPDEARKVKDQILSGAPAGGTNSANVEVNPGPPPGTVMAGQKPSLSAVPRGNGLPGTPGAAGPIIPAQAPGFAPSPINLANRTVGGGQIEPNSTWGTQMGINLANRLNARR